MVKIDQLTNEIAKALRSYTNDVEEGMQESKEKVSKDAAAKLRANSPKGKTGDYAKGWRVKRRGTSFVVHNATDYQLTHLLEKGHAKVNGGRVAPQVHIKPVEEEAIQEFEDAVEKVIRG